VLCDAAWGVHTHMYVYVYNVYLYARIHMGVSVNKRYFIKAEGVFSWQVWTSHWLVRWHWLLSRGTAMGAAGGAGGNMSLLGCCSCHHLQGMVKPPGKAALGSLVLVALHPWVQSAAASTVVGDELLFVLFIQDFLTHLAPGTETHSCHFAAYSSKHSFGTNWLAWGHAEPPSCGDGAACGCVVASGAGGQRGLSLQAPLARMLSLPRVQGAAASARG